MCENEGCNENPSFIDKDDNLLCEDCMVKEVEENDDVSYEDFEHIKYKI